MQPPPGLTTHHFNPTKWLQANPEASIDEFVDKFSSLTIEQPRTTMSRAPTCARGDDALVLWKPFPADQHEASVPPSPGGNVTFYNNQHLRGNPPVDYPLPSGPEPSLLLALDPLAPQLAEIDVAYATLNHRRMDEIVAEQGQDDDGIEDAYRFLHSYTKGRIQYTRCISRRLQAVLGVRNGRPFNFPKMSGRVFNKSPTLVEHPQHFFDVYPIYIEEERVEQAKNLMTARQNDIQRYSKEDIDLRLHPNDNCSTRQDYGQTSSQDDSTPPPPKNAIEALFRNNFSAKLAAERIMLQRATNPTPTRTTGNSKPRSPLGSVNRKTGAGLREFLIKQVQAQNSSVRKLDCNSITFTDLTEHIISGDYDDKILGYWTATREKGERIEVYEADLKTRVMNPDTCQEELRTQTWIFILISRPIVTLSATEISTKIVVPKPKVYRNAYEAKVGAAAAHPKPAPNFPGPIPTSWVVFACPLENVTKFEEEVGEKTISLAPRRSAPRYQVSDMRQDYDFSRAGIPIFEHSSMDFISKLYQKDQAPKFGTRFLSVDDLGGYCPYDYCGGLAPQVYLDKLNDREEAPEKIDINEYGEHYEAPYGLQAPSSGIWWEEFFKGVDKDKKRWEDIRSAMARGACRVVVRWRETGYVEQRDIDKTMQKASDESIKPASKSNKRGNDSEATAPVSRKAARTTTRSRRRSQLSKEVTNASPVNLGADGDSETVNLANSGNPKMLKRNGRKR